MNKFNEIMALDISRQICLRNIERIEIKSKSDNTISTPFDDISIWKHKLDLIEKRLNELVLTL